MVRSSVRRAVAASAVLAAIALLAPQGAVLPRTTAAAPGDGGRPWVMVDVDGRAEPGDCAAQQRTYRHIQTAIDAAREGDRISVCPGRYRETIRLGPRARDLYLVSEDSFQAVLMPPPTDTRPAIDITAATNVEVRGFRVRVQGRTGPVSLGPLQLEGTQVCSPAPVAVRIRDATGVTIRGVRIRADAACGYTRGISVRRSSAILSTDLVTDFLSAGVVIERGSDVGIDRSDIRFLHADLASALPGSGLDPSATGLRVDRAAAVRIRTVNVFSRVAAQDEDLPPLLMIGIDIRGTPGVSIRGDTVVRRTGRYGVRIVGSDDVSILNMLVQRSYGDGYFIDAVRGGTITGSDAELSLTGFRLGPDARGLLLRQVRGIRDQEFDCIDASVGDGTAGTANTWRRSSGRTSFPKGICVPPA